ncbi:MAG: mechanosensitive ion channel [Cyanobacteria bacterium J06555_13]
MMISMGALVAQAAPEPVPTNPGLPIPESAENAVSALNQLSQSAIENFGQSLPKLVAAIAILLIGWLLATFVSFLVKKTLKRLRVNQKVGRWLTGPSAQATPPPIEQWLALGSFALVMMFVVVAFLDALELDLVSRPLDSFLQQVVGFLPNLGGAAILLGVAWVLANVSRLVVMRSLTSFGFDERINEQLGSEPDSSTPVNNLSATVGSAFYWFVFLLFLPAVLTALSLESSLQPVQALLNDILLILPRILAALLIAVIGWFVARIVRDITTNFLTSAGANQLGTKMGLPAAEGLSIADSVGTLVYVLILIPVGISALNKLEITAISEPAIGMLAQVLETLPQVLTALFILFVAYVLGRLLSQGLTKFLTNLGFNNVLVWLGFKPTAAKSQNDPQIDVDGTSPQSALTLRTPSEIVGTIALIGIMLFAALSALELLSLTVMAQVIRGVLAVAGQASVGIFVFAVGLYLANLAYSLIGSSGGSQAKFLGQAARIAIIALVSAMALQQMGIATNIVNLAFGLMLGAIAVAFAIAFGLGGRDIAAKSVQSWLSSFNESDT